MDMDKKNPMDKSPSPQMKKWGLVIVPLKLPPTEKVGVGDRPPQVAPVYVSYITLNVLAYLHLEWVSVFHF